MGIRLRNRCLVSMLDKAQSAYIARIGFLLIAPMALVSCAPVPCTGGCLAQQRTDEAVDGKRVSQVKRATSSDRGALRHEAIRADLLLGPSEPNCGRSTIIKSDTGPNRSIAQPDPQLLEISRLEVERNCYKEAELIVRHRLERIQALIARKD